MKKLLLLAALVMVFASCEKNESSRIEKEQATIVLKVVDSNYTRAMVGDKTGTGETKIAWTKAGINFQAQGGSFNREISKDSLSEYVIKNVVTPLSISASINGGTATYNSLAPFESLAAKDMHSYGETIEFKDTDRKIDDLPVKEADVQACIPVARLEVGKVHFNTEGTVFATLNLTDVFVDGAPTKDVTVKYSDADAKTGTAAGYSKVDNPGLITNWETYKSTRGDVLIQSVPSGEGFVSGTIYPADGKYYAFNIFGQDKVGEKLNQVLPRVKFHIKNCTLNVPGTCPEEQYAIVTKYINQHGEEITSFEPGYIYQIDEVLIADKNLTYDINGAGGDKVAVVAKVTVQDWTIEPTTVELYE